jgi:hypothetical protein
MSYLRDRESSRFTMLDRARIIVESREIMKSRKIVETRQKCECDLEKKIMTRDSRLVEMNLRVLFLHVDRWDVSTRSRLIEEKWLIKYASKLFWFDVHASHSWHNSMWCKDRVHQFFSINFEWKSHLRQWSFWHNYKWCKQSSREK